MRLTIFHSTPGLLLICSSLLSPSLVMAAANSADDLVRLSDVRRGSLMFQQEQTDGTQLWRVAPSLKTDVSISVTGPIARTTLVQHFRNPGDNWAEASYAFPLPEQAAVDHMRLRIGERIIEGDIQEKQRARKAYEQAREQGQRSALVEQSRPNLFTTQVANIPPHGEIRVELEYQQELQWRNDSFSLRFPMAITPRYQPIASAAESTDTSPVTSPNAAIDGWALLPGELPHVADMSADTALNPTNIRVQLNPGFTVAPVQSPYHAVHTTQRNQATVITLADGPVAPDRDFVLRWSPRDRQSLQAAWFVENSDNGDYGLLMLMPPQDAMRANPARAREVTFVIDTSGSMGGQSIRAARQGLLAGLDRLKPSDRFNLIAFNSHATALFSQAVAADSAALSKARDWTRHLQANGGTQMRQALELALPHSAEQASQRLHQIVFITDGAVSNEAELMRLIHTRLGSARLFTVGIGSAPNAHFMTEAAHFGRGSFSYIAHPDEVEVSMRKLFAQLDHPALTDISLDLAAAADTLPNLIPDLYAGEPLSVVMKLQGTAKQAKLTGRIGLRDWQQKLDLSSNAQQQGIGVLWARRKMSDWTRQGRRGLDSQHVREQIIQLAMQHHLVSEFTSLVAVDKTPVRDPQEELNAHALKSSLPAGIAVPLARGSTPSLLLLLLGGGLMLIAWLARPRKARTCA